MSNSFSSERCDLVSGSLSSSLYLLFYLYLLFIFIFIIYIFLFYYLITYIGSITKIRLFYLICYHLSPSGSLLKVLCGNFVFFLVNYRLRNVSRREGLDALDPKYQKALSHLVSVFLHLYFYIRIQSIVSYFYYHNVSPRACAKIL
jgi:hypothetical protein